MKHITILLALLICAGCNQHASKPTDAPQEIQHPIQVVATIGMVADIVRHVGGEHVAVHQMLGPGIDPHLYKPTRDDVKSLTGADMIFYSGLMLEGKMTDILVHIARTKPVIPVTQAIDSEKLLQPPEFEGHYDPHAWNDVQTWSACINAVCDALKEHDPAHTADYEAGAADFKLQLDELHAYGLKSIASVPEERRVLITSHDAFNYFGRAYNLEVKGVQGLSTESEAGLQRINELVDELVQRKIKAVFVESSVPPRNIEALKDGATSRGHKVIIGGELFSDAMGKANTYEGTYIGMLDHNITIVARGLGGEAPEKGLHGKLSTEAASEGNN